MPPPVPRKRTRTPQPPKATLTRRARQTIEDDGGRRDARPRTSGRALPRRPPRRRRALASSSPEGGREPARVAAAGDFCFAAA